MGIMEKEMETTIMDFIHTHSFHNHRLSECTLAVFSLMLRVWHVQMVVAIRAVVVDGHK